ncbi:hypothetical protein HanRHA438_Chr04g0162871 [Helianthus annuus]|uniref:Uncharacterized protein n=1 Tax=Helianthus annuus TaxID=4232 RepID=A0A9K3NQP0_HELAN|nr:hypothetical protein HanXRQr2_Chr04g0152721 [Helianthus annuus]KAJ0580120.1 hypothetical protein HanHA300_Chr04g0125621 [Helianthus annuus]KAJ0587553.1 hypothetical protein HanIR_Chr04g0164501 [Helianthus annuus]KAJ0596055.1 hypothetical protein HanHA89_Chr04g0138421 [Helianthus annuus]KAJ0756705.1 hypothetical protein HanLR1_Chr04g0130161 [Helianthus annuus]
MILDDRYPALVKGPNFINLKPMGPSCFENACRNKRAKHHNFEGRFALEKHGRFADVVQGAHVAPVPPVAPVAPVPPPINAQIAEEHDGQLMQQAQQVAGNEDEIEVIDLETETCSSEETDSESEVEIVMSDKEEDAVRKPVPLTSENLAALLLSLQGGDGNPPSISTTDVQETAATLQVEMEIKATADDAEESTRKKQRTNSAPDDILSGPSTAPESTPIINPQPNPQTEDASKKTNTEDPDLYDFSFDFETTPYQPGSSSGVRFEAGSSSGARVTEHDKAAFRYATEKRQIFESVNDSDEDEYVKRLKRRVVVLEQDAELKNAQITSLQQDVALKEAQISSLQSKLTNRDLTVDQLQGDVGMLMSTVYDLKAKLEKKFGNEFVDKEDEQFYVGRSEQTPEQRATAHVAAEAERAAALEAYLAAKPKKRSSKSKKRQEKEKQKEKEKQSEKQLLVMKNQDMNPLDENFQLKDPTKRPDRLVMELGSSHYDEVGNKSEVACWRYELDKQMWLITRKSGHREYYAKESQFESWTKIDLKSLLCAPFYDPDINRRGRGWAFHSRLEREVRTNFATMKTAEPTIRRNPGVRDPHTKRTVRSVIWPATDKEKIIPIAKMFEKGILRNFKFWAYDPKTAEAPIVTEEQSTRIPNSYDLVSLHEEDIMVLTNHQIRTNEKYEECAKAWTSAASNILMHHLFAPDQEQGGPQV